LVLINKDGSQECITYYKSIDPVNIISEIHYSKNSPNLIVQNISRPNRDDPYSVSPAMVALPIYAKVNKLEKLQNDLAQIATYGIYAQRDMGIKIKYRFIFYSNGINEGIFIDKNRSWD
jgi:hypothetical protein